jgi:hypothetical protein
MRATELALALALAGVACGPGSTPTPRSRLEPSDPGVGSLHEAHARCGCPDGASGEAFPASAGGCTKR